VDLFALSRGTIAPQLAHWTRLLLPLLPLDLPRLFRLDGNYFNLFLSLFSKYALNYLIYLPVTLREKQCLLSDLFEG
jgi:hypothetical protein